MVNRDLGKANNSFPSSSLILLLSPLPSFPLLSSHFRIILSPCSFLFGPSPPFLPPSLPPSLPPPPTITKRTPMRRARPLRRPSSSPFLPPSLPPPLPPSLPSLCRKKRTRSTRVRT
jgi:hypothetical protein